MVRFGRPLESKTDLAAISAPVGGGWYLLDIFAVRRFKSYSAESAFSFNALHGFRCVVPRRSVGVNTSPGVPSLEARCAKP